MFCFITCWYYSCPLILSVHSASVNRSHVPAFLAMVSVECFWREALREPVVKFLARTRAADKSHLKRICCSGLGKAE